MHEATIKKAKRGNRLALAQLCKEIAKGVLFRVKCYLPYDSTSAAEAEDIAQEVLVRVCKKIHGLKNPKAFNGWLNTIILNETRRHLMSSQNNGKILYLDDYIEEALAIEDKLDSLPSEFNLTREDCDLVMELVGTLPPRQREAVALHYYQELSITESAQIMGITQQGASYYLKLARQKIREEFEKRAAAQNATYAKVAVGDNSQNDQIASRVTSNFSALALLPVGSLLGEAFKIKAAELGAQNSLVGYAFSKHAAAIAAKSASKHAIFGYVSAAMFMSLTILAIVIVPIPTDSQKNEITPTQIPMHTTATSFTELLDSKVVFSGGDVEYGHVNPKIATVDLQDLQGSIAAVNWEISATNSDDVLYSGEGGSVKEPFALLEDGDYVLIFRTVTETGFTQECYSVFQIMKDI